MLKLFTAVLLVVCFTILVTVRHVQAQLQFEPIGTFRLEVACFDRDSLALILTEYQESLVATAVLRRNNSNINNVTVFVNSVTRTWTVVEQIRSDVYCVVATGNEFAIAAPVTKPAVPKRVPQKDTLTSK